MLTRWFCCFALFCALIPSGAYCDAPDLIVQDFDAPTGRWQGASFFVNVVVTTARFGAPGADSVLRHSLSPLGTLGDPSDDIVIGECLVPAGKTTCQYSPGPGVPRHTRGAL